LKIPRFARRPHRSGDVDAPNGSAYGRREIDDDTRLLRRTRLRLMGVSGLVTLFILVVVGVATYGVVAYALDDSDKKAFTAYTSRHLNSRPSTSGPETSELGGEGANMFEIDVWPTGAVHPPRYQAIPVGLPDIESLKAAAASSTGTDERPFTSSDGTPYHVMSVVALYPDGQVGLIQFVQNRTAATRLLVTLSWTLLGGGALALLAALIAGYLYAGRALVPIRGSINRRHEALQRQREFAANASHELRTPLTVIGTSVEDLRRNRQSKVGDVGEALTDIEAEVRHMAALVDDMLLLARTDSGVVEIERVPLDLGDVATDAASMLATLGQERGVKVVLDPIPAPLTGDPLRLRQLVTILVDNAIRHSGVGSTVEARVRPAVGAAVLEVDDQGPGIKPDDLPRLFERFWRADDAPAGGTGLGLAIAKWIVEQHGGRISAENRPEGGASFRVWLPNRAGRGPVAEAAPKLGAVGFATPAEVDPPAESETPAG
jgi:signal transduction histidine kinase